MKKFFCLLVVACVLSAALPGIALSAEPQADTVTENSDSEVFVDDSDRFTAFEEELLARYADKGIRSVDVAAYAKGIDIVFVAADRKMTRAEFSAIASRSVRELRACLETSAFIVTRRHVDKKRLCAAAKTREDCQTVPQRSDGQRMGACTSSPAPCFWRRSEAQNRPA